MGLPKGTFLHKLRALFNFCHLWLAVPNLMIILYGEA
jgi:hypothetical protein